MAHRFQKPISSSTTHSALLIGAYSPAMFFLGSVLSELHDAIVICQCASIETASNMLNSLGEHSLIVLDWESHGQDIEFLRRTVDQAETVGRCIILTQEEKPTCSFGLDRLNILTINPHTPVSRLKHMLQDYLGQARSDTPQMAALDTDGADIGTPPMQLTRRQQDVLDLLQRGYSSKRIAAQLKLNKGTVDNHVGALMRALGARTRGHAIVRAIELGVLPQLPSVLTAVSTGIKTSAPENRSLFDLRGTGSRDNTSIRCA